MKISSALALSLSLAGDKLDWRITAREDGKDQAFAHYEATRVACSTAEKRG